MTGDDLRALRMSWDMTQKQVADRVGVNHATVSRWEAKGQDALPRRVELLVRAITQEIKDEKRPRSEE